MSRVALIRAAALILPVLAIAGLALRRWPDGRRARAVALAVLWNAAALLPLNILAVHLGLWRFAVEGGLLGGIPVDFLLGWSLLWGAAPLLASRRPAILAWAGAWLACDLLLMPALAPALELGRTWLAGELALLTIAFVPGQLLARWTEADRRLEARAVLGVALFALVAFHALPLLALEVSGRSWREALARLGMAGGLPWGLAILLAVLGLVAVQELVERGRGTPFPFDPPRRLVTSGPYAYVANPMQLATALLYLLLAWAASSTWLAAAAIMVAIYASGLALWDERGDMLERFGGAWLAYTRSVRRWLPRFRPYRAPGEPARLHVAASCGACRGVGRFITRLGPRGLVVVAAEEHPDLDLERLAYDPRDGSPLELGVVALARALEHVHLGWAIVAWHVRLPLVRSLTQLVADAVGGGPRRIGRGRRLSPRAPGPRAARG